GAHRPGPGLAGRGLGPDLLLVRGHRDDARHRTVLVHRPRRRLPRLHGGDPRDHRPLTHPHQRAPLMNETLATVVVGLFGITGSLLRLSSVLVMFRVRDCLSRINVCCAAAGVGMPRIVAADYVFDLHSSGFGWGSLIMAVVAVMCLIIVSSVASNTLARSAMLSGQPVSGKTSPNRLAQPPEGTVDAAPDTAGT